MFIIWPPALPGFPHTSSRYKNSYESSHACDTLRARPISSDMRQVEVCYMQSLGLKRLNASGQKSQSEGPYSLTSHAQDLHLHIVIW